MLYYGMSNNVLSRLTQEKSRLLEEMSNLSQLLHGSWVERYSTCTRRDCKCHKGQRHGPRHYLVINEKGRQRQKYIPNSHVEAAQTGLAQYKRLRQIIDRITQLNLLIMKGVEHESQ